MQWISASCYASDKITLSLDYCRNLWWGISWSRYLSRLLSKFLSSFWSHWSVTICPGFRPSIPHTKPTVMSCCFCFGLSTRLPSYNPKEESLEWLQDSAAFDCVCRFHSSPASFASSQTCRYAPAQNLAKDQTASLSVALRDSQHMLCFMGLSQILLFQGGLSQHPSGSPC